MNWNMKTIIEAFSENNNKKSLIEGLHGLEKECLRVQPNGDLALTPHPKALGDKLTDPEITTDFSESQIEFITPPLPSIEESLTHLEKLHTFAHKRLKNELLWPMSMPCKLPEHDAIPIAHYGNSPEAQEKEIYRRGLALRYGKYMQMISGVHYNTSFTQEFWYTLMKAVGDTSEKQHFINEGYLHLVRNFIRYRWLLAYLFGASPLNHESYRCTSLHKDRNEAVSLRLSRCGYSNPANIHITYNNFQEHFNDIKKAVETPHPAYTKLGLEKDGQRIQLNDHILQIGNEYYFSIRLKPPKPYDDVLDALAKHGVEYIEVRIFDLNPFDGIGVNADQLYFCRLFLLFCLFEPSPPVDEKMLNVSTQNQQIVALKGRNPSLKIEKDGEMIGLTEWSKELLEAMQPLAELLDQNFKKPLYTRILAHYMQALKDPSLLPGFKVMNEMKEKKEDFLEYGLEKAKEYHELFSKKDA